MTEKKFIPLSVPNFCGNEKAYVNDAVVSEWVSTGGSLVPKFEQAVASYVACPARWPATPDVRPAPCHDDGGCGPRRRGAGAHADLYCGGEPRALCRGRAIFIGCGDSLCICPTLVEEYLAQNAELRDGNASTSARARTSGPWWWCMCSATWPPCPS